MHVLVDAYWAVNLRAVWAEYRIHLRVGLTAADAGVAHLSGRILRPGGTRSRRLGPCNTDHAVSIIHVAISAIFVMSCPDHASDLWRLPWSQPCLCTLDQLATTLGFPEQPPYSLPACWDVKSCRGANPTRHAIAPLAEWRSSIDADHLMGDVEVLLQRLPTPCSLNPGAWHRRTCIGSLHTPVCVLHLDEDSPQCLAVPCLVSFGPLHSG